MKYLRSYKMENTRERETSLSLSLSAEILRVREHYRVMPP